MKGILTLLRSLGSYAPFPTVPDGPLYAAHIFALSEGRMVNLEWFDGNDYGPKNIWKPAHQRFQRPVERCMAAILGVRKAPHRVKVRSPLARHPRLIVQYLDLYSEAHTL